MLPIDAETFAAAIGLALAVALRFVPPLAGGWDALSRNAKIGVLAAVCVTCGGSALLGRCGLDSACLSANWQEAARVTVIAFGMSQVTYMAIRKPSDK